MNLNTFLVSSLRKIRIPYVENEEDLNSVNKKIFYGTLENKKVIFCYRNILIEKYEFIPSEDILYGEHSGQPINLENLRFIYSTHSDLKLQEIEENEFSINTNLFSYLINSENLIKHITQLLFSKGIILIEKDGELINFKNNIPSGSKCILFRLIDVNTMSKIVQMTNFQVRPLAITSSFNILENGDNSYLTIGSFTYNDNYDSKNGVPHIKNEEELSLKFPISEVKAGKLVKLPSVYGLFKSSETGEPVEKNIFSGELYLYGNESIGYGEIIGITGYGGKNMDEASDGSKLNIRLANQNDIILSDVDYLNILNYENKDLKNGEFVYFIVVNETEEPISEKK